MVLCFSLFYNRLGWPILLRKLNLVLSRLESEQLINASVILFGTLGGQNISIVLYCKGAKQIETCRKSLIHQFDSFFKKHPSSNLLETIAESSIFLNFPNNSLQFNLYKDGISPKKGKPDLIVNYFHSLSKLYMRFFTKKSGNILFSDPVHFLFISQVIFLKAFEVTSSQSILLFNQLHAVVNNELLYHDTLHAGLDIGKTALSAQELRLIFEGNYEFLINVINGIKDVNSNELQFHEKWMNNYYTICRDAFKYFKVNSTTNAFKGSVCPRLRSFIHKVFRTQIGLLGGPPANELILFYLGKQSFEAIKKTESNFLKSLKQNGVDVLSKNLASVN